MEEYGQRREEAEGSSGGQEDSLDRSRLSNAFYRQGSVLGALYLCSWNEPGAAGTSGKKIQPLLRENL